MSYRLHQHRAFAQLCLQQVCLLPFVLVWLYVCFIFIIKKKQPRNTGLLIVYIHNIAPLLCRVCTTMFYVSAIHYNAILRRKTIRKSKCEKIMLKTHQLYVTCFAGGGAYCFFLLCGILLSRFRYNILSALLIG